MVDDLTGHLEAAATHCEPATFRADDCHRLVEHVYRLERERDEARAEAGRLRQKLEAFADAGIAAGAVMTSVLRGHAKGMRPTFFRLIQDRRKNLLVLCGISPLLCGDYTGEEEAIAAGLGPGPGEGASR